MVFCVVDARKKNVTAPALQVTRLLQTTSYLEKYYVKPNYLKKWGRRDIKRRAMFKEHEMERSSLRLIKKSDILPPAVREKAASDMDELPLNSSITRVRNRCVLTDRGRGNVGRFRVSRMMFRYFADKGLVAGVTRSQWWITLLFHFTNWKLTGSSEDFVSFKNNPGHFPHLGLEAGLVSK